MYILTIQIWSRLPGHTVLYTNIHIHTCMINEHEYMLKFIYLVHLSYRLSNEYTNEREGLFISPTEYLSLRVEIVFFLWGGMDSFQLFFTHENNRKSKLFDFFCMVKYSQFS